MKMLRVLFPGLALLVAGLPPATAQSSLQHSSQALTHQELHNPRYSAVSNPFNRKYQNCTEFVLDVINAAIYETNDHRQIKANIEASHSRLR